MLQLFKVNALGPKKSSCYQKKKKKKGSQMQTEALHIHLQDGKLAWKLKLKEQSIERLILPSVPSGRR